MSIEIATPTEASEKEKGDLLEKLSAEFMKTQGYDVETQIRITASELDLLCKHPVNRKTVYVECKAYRNTISAEVLTKLLGTVDFNHYTEGWLISTGPFGKDAKGFQTKWENKPSEESQKLSLYTPDRVIENLIRARVIKPVPQEEAEKLIKNPDNLGSWMLVVTPYGKHWTMTCLGSGVPEGVLVFSATTGELVEDSLLLRNISRTDTSLRNLDFSYVNRIRTKVEDIQPNKVVEVQYGDSWADYRPARPQDFVGRLEAQQTIIHFFDDVRSKKTRTRVIAITGDSGMGKSSLISKVRERVTNKRYKNSFFIYAVDVRAAKNDSYILSALLTCLQEAAKNGFGDKDVAHLKITSFTEPLESPSIRQYIESLERNKQVVCLVFDQFEELYSKPNLFSVFETAQRLFLSVTSAGSNLVLGFAWKSDSTVQQNHPAYFMWHSLGDQRLPIELKRFRYDEASKAITLLEKEVGEKLSSNLRRQLLENTQGYPWLLKKLSIHIYTQIKSGVSQSELIENALDVESLFKSDLQNLTSAERASLQHIAENAPADWVEVVEMAGNDVLRALINKRLVIRSGDKLTVYWDIFREYLVSKKVPSIPLTYLPTYQSLNTVLMVAQQLSKETSVTYESLSKSAHIKVSTVTNVVHDLIMFGVAKGEYSIAKLDEGVESSDPENILKRIRQTLASHAVTLNLRKLERGTTIKESEMIDILKGINPTAPHGEKTWKIYADRILNWLTATGYIITTSDG
jgi:hypothetical protein